MTPVIIFLNDHKSETLESVINVIENFKINNTDSFIMKIGAGNAGIEAATNSVIKNLALNIIINLFCCKYYVFFNI